MPATTSRFLGREREISELVKLIADARLVTLNGAPGIGKTRLALRVAETWGDATAAVELAPVGDAALVPRAVASALSVQEVGGQDLTDTIGAHLLGRRMLLVLDNCEHVIDACAQLVDALLGTCPDLRVIATSRAPLGTATETVWQVPPLSVPLAGDADRPEDALRYESVGLFVERAAATEPGFTLNAYLAPDVVEICRRLDGIPLAIELAAARVHMLTPAEIADRLDDRFGLLTSATDADQGRHRTLEAALDLSHELLSLPERALLRRISAFAGGFDLEAAEAVCAGGEVEAGDVPDLLDHLVAKSLVVPVSDAPARYRLLETIRAYAVDRLEEADEVADLGRAHAGHYLAVAEEAEPLLTGAGQREWFDRLERERENLRRALEWSLGHGHGEWALRLAGAVVLFWRVRCHFGEGRELLEAAVMATEDAPPALRAKALWGAGFMALMTGDKAAALDPVEESLAIADDLADIQIRGRALLILGNARQHCGDPKALALLGQSAASAREAGDSWCLAHALGCAGLEHCYLDDLAAARPLLEQCVTVAREAGDKQGLRFGLLGLGEAAARQGDLGRAESAFDDTLAVAEELGEKYTKGTVLMNLGQCALARGEPDRARQFLDGSLALLREAKPMELIPPLVLRARVASAQGDRACAERLLEEALPLARAGAASGAYAVLALGQLAAQAGNVRTAHRLFEETLDLARQAYDRRASASALHALADLESREGDVKRAAVLHREALQLRHETGDTCGIAVSLAAIAGLVVVGGRWEHAARLLGAAQAVAESGGLIPAVWAGPKYESDVARVREELSTTRFEAVFAEGAALALDGAVAQASVTNGNGRPAGGWSSLTDTERQVAELVAQGHTNQEIADLLFLSLGTIKKTLSRILRKMGVRRRADVAREVSRLRA